MLNTTVELHNLNHKQYMNMSISANEHSIIHLVFSLSRRELKEGVRSKIEQYIQKFL